MPNRPNEEKTVDPDDRSGIRTYLRYHFNVEQAMKRLRESRRNDLDACQAAEPREQTNAPETPSNSRREMIQSSQVTEERRQYEQAREQRMRHFMKKQREMRFKDMFENEPRRMSRSRSREPITRTEGPESGVASREYASERGSVAGKSSRHRFQKSPESRSTSRRMPESREQWGKRTEGPESGVASRQYASVGGSVAGETSVHRFQKSLERRSSETALEESREALRRLQKENPEDVRRRVRGTTLSRPGWLLESRDVLDDGEMRRMIEDTVERLSNRAQGPESGVASREYASVGGSVAGERNRSQKSPESRSTCRRMLESSEQWGNRAQGPESGVASREYASVGGSVAGERNRSQKSPESRSTCRRMLESSEQWGNRAQGPESGVASREYASVGGSVAGERNRSQKSLESRRTRSVLSLAEDGDEVRMEDVSMAMKEEVPSLSVDSQARRQQRQDRILANSADIEEEYRQRNPSPLFGDSGYRERIPYREASVDFDDRMQESRRHARNALYRNAEGAERPLTIGIDIDKLEDFQTESEAFHALDEIDPLNRLYDIDGFEAEDGGGDDSGDDGEPGLRRTVKRRPSWFFTNNRTDVVAVLSCYSQTNNARRKLTCTTPTKYTTKTVLTRLCTQQGMPVIIYHNQLYRPKEETLAGSVSARCTWKDPISNKTCPGSVNCHWRTGSVTLRSPCNHESRRDWIALELIIRKITVMILCGTSKERIYGIATADALEYEIPHLVQSNATISKKLGRRGKLQNTDGNAFPPCFDFQTIGIVHNCFTQIYFVQDGVTCVLDTSGNFSATGSVILVWKVDGANKYLNAGTKILHIDGKFSKVPSQFKQVYVLSTEHPTTRTAVPLLFALSTSSSQETYKAIFEMAKNQGIDPEYVYSDFELAAINAAKDTWPTTVICGCWRHWKVAIRKNLIKLIGKQLADSPLYKNLLRSIYSLSFCPITKLDDYYNVLMQRTITGHPRMPEFYTYLTNTFLGRAARFERELWNCEERVRRGLEYTNNISEVLFSKYSRLFHHTNYKQLSTAVRQSRIWSQSIYRDIDSNRAKLNVLSAADPLFLNADFISAVKRLYQNYDEFNRAVFPFMKIPKIYH